MSEAFTLPLPKAGLKELLLWVAGRRHRVRVCGYSMQPLISPQADLLYAPKAYQHCLPQVGDVVVVRHPYRTDLLLVKIITASKANGEFWLEGLNAADSTDSRTFGAVPRQLIYGRVMSRLP